MDPGRKKFITQLSTGIVAASIPGWSNASEEITDMIDTNDFSGDGAPDDEKYWNRIAKKYYELATDYVNLENGYYGIQPKPVLMAFQENVIKANKGSARFARKEYPGLMNNIKKELANFLEVSDEEILITRNATEALNIAIQGYPFKAGDEVLLNQLDYFSMIETFRMLEQRGLIKVNAFDMPLIPTSDEEIVEIYRKQITLRTKVILLTHLSNINGLIVPVQKISAMAKERGIDTITDSAHALGQIPFRLPDLGSDFVGLNLHKWIGNPIGAGVLYVRKERIAEMKALYGDVVAPENSIAKLGHFGTTPFAVIMTIPDSIAFQKLMDVNKLTKRLHFLKERWMKVLKEIPGIELVSPVDPGLSCAIASFRVKNKTAAETADYLYQQRKIFTVNRQLGEKGCVRVTPAAYNSLNDIDRFVDAVKNGF